MSDGGAVGDKISSLLTRELKDKQELLSVLTELNVLWQNHCKKELNQYIIKSYPLNTAYLNLVLKCVEYAIKPGKYPLIFELLAKSPVFYEELMALMPIFTVPESKNNNGQVIEYLKQILLVNHYKINIIKAFLDYLDYSDNRFITVGLSKDLMHDLHEFDAILSQHSDKVNQDETLLESVIDLARSYLSMNSSYVRLFGCDHQAIRFNQMLDNLLNKHQLESYLEKELERSRLHIKDKLIDRLPPNALDGLSPYEFSKQFIHRKVDVEDLPKHPTAVVLMVNHELINYLNLNEKVNLLIRNTLNYAVRNAIPVVLYCHEESQQAKLLFELVQAYIAIEYQNYVCVDDLPSTSLVIDALQSHLNNTLKKQIESPVQLLVIGVDLSSVFPGEDRSRLIDIDIKDKDGLYLTDVNYQLGAYNDLIAALRNTDNLCNLVNIPNFDWLSFKNTPIVYHVLLSEFLQNITTLVSDEHDKAVYTRQFFYQELFLYKKLSCVIQKDFILTMYQYLNNKIDEYREQVIAHNNQWNDVFWRTAEEHYQQLSQLEKAYSKVVGPTFLDFKLMHLNKLLIHGTSQLTLTDTLIKISPKVKDSILRKAVSRVKSELFRDENPVLQQLQLYQQVSVQLKKDIKEFLLVKVPAYVKQIQTGLLNCKITSNKKILTQEFICFTDLYQAMALIINSIDTDVGSIKPVELVYKHRSWKNAYKVLKQSQELFVYQMMLDYLEYGDVVESDLLVTLLERIKRLLIAIESTEQYQAMLYLKLVKKHLKSHKWKLGFRWQNTDYQGITVPKRVKKQLDIIDNAKLSGDYLDAKQQLSKFPESMIETH